jgi:hypothetical protein
MMAVRIQPSFVAIDSLELKSLYVDRGLTTSEIARRFGCSAMTIRRRLMRFEIPVRPRGPCPKHADRRLGLVPVWAMWSSALAYAIGLIATDGNLSPDGRHLSLPSKDLDLLESLRGCLGLMNSIRRRSNARGHIYRMQWGDRLFYDWLQSIGLTPAKSLTLGPLAVPDEYFADFFRGCIDGEGSITTYVDRYNTFKKPTYVYTRLYVSIVSASPRFVEWLRTTVRRITGLSGELTVRTSPRHHDLWRLRYAKAESLTLLRFMYYAPDVPCLRRKRDIAAPFLMPREQPSRRGPGRPRVV